MANTQEAIAWILLNSDKLRLKIKNKDWIKEVFPDYVDVACSIQLDLNLPESFGSGAAPSQDLALCKSFAEALEREAVFETKMKTSNGFAAHLDQKNAEINASNELLERHLFLSRFLLNKPFLKIPEKVLFENSWYRNVQIWANKNGLRFELYSLGYNGCLALTRGEDARNPFGLVVSTAIKGSIQDSMLGSSIECLRRSYFYLNQESVVDSHSLSLQDFLKIDRPTFGDHGRLGLNIEYSKSLSDLFSNEEESLSNIDSGPQLPKIDFQNVYLPKIEAYKGCPYAFVQAQSDLLQQMFLGVPNEAKINLNALSRFAGRNIDFADINKTPHPFD